MNRTITAERVRHLLLYDPDSGLCTWLNPNPKGGAKKGERAGTFDVHGNRIVGLDGSRYLEHRIIWLYMTGAWPAQEIDHIDGVGSGETTRRHEERR